MSSTDFAKTLAARARTRAQMLAMDGSGSAVRGHVGASLERRIDGVRRAARAVGPMRGSRIGPQLPKP
jgi:hypothetical protein